MSIKSQKSLNDECTEIFERSYSIMSASDDSISSDDDENLSSEMMKKLTPAVLSKLKKCFKRAREQKTRDLDKKVEEIMRAAAAEEGIEFAEPPPADNEHLYLNESGFVAALEKILGNPKYRSHARALFLAVDRFRAGRVSWSQLVARLVAGGGSLGSRRDSWRPLTDAGVIKLKHCNRETLVTLVRVDREDGFRFVAVSRGGRVGVYSGDMELLKSYEIFYHRTGVRSRVKNRWITDAVYMSDAACLVFSGSDRSLTIYDASAPAHSPLHCITGLPDIPTCLAHRPAVAGLPSELLLGTERGDLLRLRFLRPRLALLPPAAAGCHFWTELSRPPLSSYCAVQVSRAGHGRAVRRVAILRPDLALSCSRGADVSLRLTYLSGKLDDCEISVPRGVSCFHAVPELRLAAGGGADGAVRLWTLGQRAPLAALRPPPAPRAAPAAVVDVRILPAESVVLGYYSNCVIHIWDLHEESLLQSVQLKFPFLGLLGNKIEFGTTCIHLGAPRRMASKEIREEEEDGPRRGSSVYEGSPGGLMLQPDPDPHLHQTNSIPPESPDSPELLVSGRDSLCVLRLAAPSRSGRRAASAGCGADPVHTGTRCSSTIGAAPATPSPPSPPSPPSAAGSPAVAEGAGPGVGLDQLIANAGLEGILEKNFVLMRGLKHDLNEKLHEMESNSEIRESAVRSCAPHRALPSAALRPPPDWRRLAARCAAVSRYFPGPSVNVTPSGSQSTTPRRPQGKLQDESVG